MQSNIVNIIMRDLLLVSLFVVLSACGKSPAVDDLPATDDLPSRESVTSAGSTTPPEKPPVPISPTPLPIADSQGISFTYDQLLLGTLQDAGHQPAQASVTAPARPEHIAFTFSGSDRFESGEVLVIPIEHYRVLSDAASSHIDDLSELVASRSAQPSSPLPLYPLPQAAVMFELDPSYVSFESGSGVSFVTAIGVDSEHVLMYAFQGITNDGKFYVSTQLPIKMNIRMADALDGADVTLARVADRQLILKKELEDTINSLNSSMRSLEIRPQNDFPSPAPHAYLSYPGILLAYDPQLSGNAAVEKKPPVYAKDDGASVFLSGVPDAIQVTFDGAKEYTWKPNLRVQPLRGATGQFYPSIPEEQKKQVEAMEEEFQADGHSDETIAEEGFEHFLPFQSGIGKRYIQQTGPDSLDEQAGRPSYEYRGVTADGRYYVQFSHPLRISGAIDDLLLNSGADDSTDFAQIVIQLDKLIHSLVIATDASTDSSMPVNAPDCTLDAQFVEDVTIPDYTIIERGHTFAKTWRIRNSGTCSWTPAFQIHRSGGNPLQWGKPSVMEIVSPGEETEVSVEIVSPEIPGNYQAWWQLVNDMGEPFGPFYYVLFESPRPATDIPDYGVIEGELSYPASGMPAMTIYFLRTDDSQRFALETENGWIHYANELPVGDYYVFARVAGDESDSGGGYTEAVLCGMTCDDHTLIPVTIEEGKATRDINIADWYAPTGTFPLP